MNKIFTKKNTMGFSLVEVMVTIAIIGTLASIAVPVTLAQRTSSTVTAQKTDLINISTQLETVLTSWNGTPPAQTTITTSAGTWTATPSGQATAVSGPVSAGTNITGTMWTDGSYCIKATNSSGGTLIYRSDKDTVEETANCPTTALGSIGSIPASVATTLPAAPTGLVATSPSDGTITLSWTAVSGATSYTIKIPGMDAISTTSTAATMEGVNGGSNTVTVYAKNANGSGAGATTNVTVATGETGDSLPAGAVITTTQTTVPEGWLEADGRAVLRAAYPALYAAIGTTYGAGDGSTTFNLPNLKGRVIVGQDPAQAEFDTIGETGGSKTHTLVTANLPAHNHNVVINDPGHNHTQNAHTHIQNAHGHGARVGVSGADDNNHTGNGDFVGDSDAGYKTVRGVTVDAATATNQNTTATNNASTTGITATVSNTGSATPTAVSNLQPYFVMKYIIKTAASIMPSDALLDGRISTIENKLTGVTQAADINHTHTWADISNAPGGYDMTAAGTIVQTSSPTLPSGWLLADGSAVSRTTYASLFAAIGTRYGAGDGSTTFNLPNLKGKSVKGFDATQTEFNTLGATGGNKTHTLSVANMPAHTHTGTTTTNGSHNHSQDAHSHGLTVPFMPNSWENGNYGAAWGGGFQGRVGVTGGWGIGTDGRQPYIYYNGDHSHSFTTSSVGSGQAYSILDPYITLYFMIKHTPAGNADPAFETRLNNNSALIATAQANITTLQGQMTSHTHTWAQITSVPTRLGPTSAVTTDWNNAIETGAYVSNNAANAPTTGAGVLYMGTVQASTDNKYVSQEVHEYNTDTSSNTKTFRRDSNNVGGVRTWGPWYRVFSSQAELESLIAVTPGTGGDSMPIGSIIQTSGAATPTGWIVADGSAVSRTTYSNLFAAIGTTYGAGDGSTTFNLPNLKGRVIVGQDPGQTEFNVIGETGGEKAHTLTTAEMPAHSHSITVNDPGHNHTQNPHTHNSVINLSLVNIRYGGSNTFNSDGAADKSGGIANTTATNNANTTGITASSASVGSGQAFTNMQPYIVLRYLIKTTPAVETGTTLESRVTTLENSLNTKAPLNNPSFTGNVSKPGQTAFMVSTTAGYHPGGWLNRSLFPNSAGTNTGVIQYNVGNALNSSTGEFTAPKAGVYMFYSGGWSSYNGAGNRYAWSFYVNGVQKYISGGNTSSGDTPLASSTIMLKLNAGDKVTMWMYSSVVMNVGTGGHESYWGGYFIG